MQLKIAHKISAMTVIMVLITASIITFVFYKETSKILINHALDAISNSVNNQGFKLQEHILNQREDTLLLARLPGTQETDSKNNSFSDNTKNHVEEIFTALMLTKPDYLQIRYIDIQGQEVIRVENINGDIIVVPDNKLQDKSTSSYFQQTIKLNLGETYLSEINLNRERGVIASPHQVVLRTATPVINKLNNKLTGLLIINAEISHQLNNIQAAIQNKGRDIYISNDNGYYLLHPNPEKQYGFDLKTQYRAQEDFPLLSKIFIPGNRDRDIILLPETTGSDDISIFTKIHFDILNPERFITVGITESYRKILDHETKALQTTFLIIISIALSALIISLLLSFRLSRPLQQITSALGSFKDGNIITSELPTKSNDEIGLLARAFISMSEQVHETQKNLGHLNENLESSIRERTHALTESKRMLQMVMDTIPARVFWKDLNGKYIGCNSLFANDTGLNDPKLVMGKTDYEMPWKEQADLYTRDDQQVISTGQAKLNIEEPQTTPSGETTWLETSKVPLTDSNNESIGILGTYQDITLRKASQLELHESQSKQHAILENMIDGVLSIDPKGIVHSFNKAAETIFGYSPEEVIGKNVSMLMPEPYHSAHDGYLHNYDSTGVKKIIGIGREVEGLRKDGSTFPLDLAVSEVKRETESIYIGIVRDITERKRMDIMKNEFISTVSHELRTPLTSIKGSLGLLTGGAVGELSDTASEMLKIASNNTERLLMLINDILDIQKIESGVMAFKFKNIELTPFLEQAIEHNAAYGMQFDITFVLNQTVEKTFVYADHDRLMQIMSNLMSNAAKFSPANSKVEISSSIHDDTIRISVTDHGPGIPEEFKPKLFEKFTQSDSSDTRHSEGTGLGLSITKVITERHGGRIGFISQLGVGSTFYIDLPQLHSIESLDQEHIPDALPSIHKSCILIVEDDPDVAALIQRMLAESGYDSDIAYSADQARKLLAERGDQYRLMTLDIMLPDEDGISLLTSLRKEAEYRDLPVVVISVKADEARNSIEGGAIEVVDWLSKPIDQNRLQEVISHAARKCSLIKILHVEDEDDVHRIISVMLKDQCSLDRASTFAEAKDKISSQQYDLVLLDIGLPDGSGLDLLEPIEANSHPPQVIIFSAQDVTAEYADQVNAVLVKSRTSNNKLLEIIKAVIN